MKKQDKTTTRLKLDYILQNAGWGILRLEQGDKIITHDISYLHDSLKELIDTANLLLQEKSKQVRVVFMAEPGELHLLLMKQPDNTLKLEVRQFEDWCSWGMYPDDRYDILLQSDISLIEWAKIVLSNVEKIYIENGINVYKEKWVSDEFPLYEYLQLKKLISKQ